MNASVYWARTVTVCIEKLFSPPLSEKKTNQSPGLDEMKERLGYTYLSGIYDDQQFFYFTRN